MKKKFKIKKRYIALGLILVLIIVLIAGGQKAKRDAKEYYEVVRGDLSEEVVLAGDIDIEDRADLGFGFSGRVSSVMVQEGQEVKEGDFIAQLSMNQLQAELLEAQANLQQAQADKGVSGVDLDFAYQNLANTIAEQNVVVEAAYKNLLNEGLAAYTDDDTSAEPPIISGTYTSEEEGEYILNPYSSSSPSGYSFTLSGLERGSYSVQTSSPGKLGERGLYIAFDEDSRYGSNTQWIVSIPNMRSSTYTTRKNTYDQAVAARDTLISRAQDDYTQTQTQVTVTSKTGAAVAAAEARVAAVRAQMRDGVIRAPFDGIVGRINLTEGEVVSANTAYVTLVGQEEFELQLNVPEIDVAKISVQDPIVITLDAYGDEFIWSGVINNIDVIDTVIDGVPVYETRATILEADSRIRVGMGAKARIVTQEKENILVAPKYFFTRTSNGYETSVVRDGEEVAATVVLGIEGSGGLVEIVSGLQAGDTIVYQRPLR